ncbi:uncharacterized protein LOC132272578 [Cornus florida]|uniref:uncharacterized protein LOC132272578 n=1 Tax=Cornus florida TaxID=4283 RepID=UPI0028A09856|nr:uncharacterized protein LOC132272578 [Cornus florida]
MASTKAFNVTAQIDDPNLQTDSPPFWTPIRPSSRRTPSFSSSPSLSSNSSSGSSSSFRDCNSRWCPSTPLRFSGIPFSWEWLPGIPKKQIPEKKDSSVALLPLPPAKNTTSTSSKKSKRVQKYSSRDSFRMDPFFTALVECSKDDHDTIDDVWIGSSKVTRSLSDRFGFVSLTTSCKRACDVSESIISLPRYKHS